MRTTRALVASDPLAFGRGRIWSPADSGARQRMASDDFRLFATTFAAGFLFVSILIA